MDPIPVRANTQKEFEQATSNGDVYGTMTRSLEKSGYTTKHVYIELGEERPVRYIKKPKKSDDTTKFKLFVDCSITAADSYEELQDETKDLETFDYVPIQLFY